MLQRAALLFFVLLFAPLAWADPVDPKDPKWNQLVVGSLNDLPNGPVKTFLHATHFNNVYGKTIGHKTRALGPFSPEANLVFWIPTLELPMNSDTWRFLSDMQALPESILQNTFVRKGDATYIRMFLHPFSTEAPVFRKLAKKYGGFKYEFQAVTTASVRSFVAWKTSAPKPEGGPGSIDFPTDKNKFIWPKVSVFNTDINGSRINPLKKLVRAYSVTQLMSSISPAEKARVGFDFAGEHVVAVPDGTDAGFVVRQVLPEFVGQKAAFVEPGFSMMGAERLNQITRGMSGVDTFITENIFRPIAKTFAYLLMEEGMIGEYHSQNINFAMSSDGRPIGRVLLQDADAFRTSILLRAANGRDIAPLRKIETPFFFMKEPMFTLQGGPNSDSINLNGLLFDYLADRDQLWTPIGAILRWCGRDKPLFKIYFWCTEDRVRTMFLQTMADELSPYLNRPVSIEELRFHSRDSGNVGLVKMYRERLEIVGNKARERLGPVNPALQETLFDEFSRLYEIGSADSLGSFSLKTTEFFLDVEGENQMILAFAKGGPKTPKSYKGVALLGHAGDAAAEAFAEKISRLAGTQVIASRTQKPILQDVGGGSNRMRRPVSDCEDLFQEIVIP